MQEFGIFPLLPAYGRDYKSKEALIKDWNEGKDFLTMLNGYCSKRDFKDGELINFRYDKFKKSLVHTNGN